MMNSPEWFIEELKDEPIERLIKERNQIIRELRFYERNSKEDSDIGIHPSPETVYYWNHQYLLKLIELIIQRLREEKHG